MPGSLGRPIRNSQHTPTRPEMNENGKPATHCSPHIERICMDVDVTYGGHMDLSQGSAWIPRFCNFWAACPAIRRRLPRSEPGLLACHNSKFHASRT
ncbi:hypothetical protein CPSG_04081 [Coccidioides posadasii str. Silveira]|uniref:Uncharacterized protein n=1 Tax=Coccidioides posadasii (strain RMSCC 757 / Silveira) TaxID=443226 RepID=E9D1M3_COCPS|nr:hypothetical protein CPSG_04081 [Coccidioides posadasii str. Silveira]